MTEAREPADEQAQLDPTGHQRTDHGSTDAAPRRARPTGPPGPWRIALSIVSVIALIGGVVAAVVVFGNRPVAPRTPAVDLIAATLLTPADLAGTAGQATWTEKSTERAVTPDTAQPACLATAEGTEPVASSSAVRALAAPGDLSAIHEIDRYASPEDAAAAFTARVAQLGSCRSTTARAVDAATVTNLGQSAVAATFVEDDSPAVSHTFVVSRDADTVNIVDLSRPGTAIAATPASQALGRAYARACTADGGWCGENVHVTATPVLPAEPAGWLSVVDLPRIKPGVGAWTGTDIATPAVSTSGCEGFDMTKLGGSVSTGQRTYLVADDPSAPKTFGVDQVTITFKTPQEVATTVATISKNLDSCATRTPTATVKKLGAVTGGAPGAAWTVTHKVSPTASLTYQVALLSRGTTLTYLLATPSAGYEFTAAQWSGVASRAGVRLTQA